MSVKRFAITAPKFYGKEKHSLRKLREPPWWPSGIESAYNAGVASFISGLGRSPGEGNGYPLLYSCLRNPMDRGKPTWTEDPGKSRGQATVHGVTKSWT